MDISYALRLAGRELRGGVRGFVVFLACLILGAGTIAAVGSLGAAVDAGLRADARRLLGGDVSARLPLRPATDAERTFLAASGVLSETIRMRAMARTRDGERRSLIELQAVDAAYPLYGAVGLAPTGPLAPALAREAGVFGAVAEANAATRLGLSVGDEFRVGDAVLRLSAIIETLPDAAFAGLALGPRVIVVHAALAETGLLRPGAIVSFEYRLRLSGADNADAWIARARDAFPQAGWQLRGSADASPSLQRLIDRIGFFLHLVGVTALLVGGIGIANAVAGYIDGKTASIATLKCLGASTGLIVAAYLLQILALAAVAIVLGLILGAAAPVLAGPALAGLLPVPLPLALYPEPLALAALCGLLATLLFALWPLAAIGRIPPAVLWRDPSARRTANPLAHRADVRRLELLAAITSAGAGLGLAAVIVLTAPVRNFALWYVGGALAAFALLRGAAWLAVAAARRGPRPRWMPLRLALANLHRPGNQTDRIVLSLGLGLSVMIALALVQGNLASEIEGSVADRAPAYFIVDIQPDQLAGFGSIVGAVSGAAFDQVPMLRGRITQLNGVAVEQAHVAPEAQWALSNERGLTYAAAPPAGSQIVAGEWWPADYRGPPLVSFDAELAHGMGLKIGDTLTVNLLGRDISARIVNLRRIEWSRLGINFALVFAPGTLETAPQTHLAALYASPSDAERLVRQITDAYPNVSAIPVRDALAAVTRVVAAAGGAIRFVALAAVIAGVLVLGGAVAASHRRRVYDAVLLKVLGASRGVVAAAFLIEHLLLGLATAVIAAAFGSLAAWALVTGQLKLGWVFLPGPLLVISAGAAGLTLLFGLAGTWRALGAKPARYLRGE